MGWQDREYARPYAPGRSVRPANVLRKASENIVTTLIVINVAVFVLTTLNGGPNPMTSPVFRFMALYTPAVAEGEIWRLITAQYLHWSGGHIFMNMLGLFFLGKPLAMEWGTKHFLFVYTAAGLLGNLFFVALTGVGWLEWQSVAAGASGCVLGLLGAAAVRYPHAQVLVYFLFPIKIRTAALLFAGWYVLNLISRGENAGGDACHVAGLAFGALWAYRGEPWWRGHSFHLPRRRTRTSLRGSPPPGRFVDPAEVNFQDRMEQRRYDAETVDRILKKVYEGGIHSLTESEKQALQEATARQRATEP